ncbi:ribosome-associated heat shock protein Hsp15 [Sphingomonas vulcanisoli]|uniref:Ribosome-associated heat shock protein Hsp15 n=1 Tax=Sphingomonas vulcanisoli TaxID=1658060 RepID=A0ABX0TWT4_9SPHN|nr:RNA-binding S4 domain-containing protein [Sphingomonas vulcanisoli]NIJ09513.1 ribosome-associated heat shock protein Hsp15 [Sphingomonas vulcanisoli]
MRLDKLLWFLRITRTRPLAAALVEQGRLRIDGRPCDKPHAEVRPGMVLSFAHQDRVHILRIEALPDRRGPATEARACYTDLSPQSPHEC